MSDSMSRLLIALLLAGTWPTGCFPGPLDIASDSAPSDASAEGDSVAAAVDADDSMVPDAPDSEDVSDVKPNDSGSELPDAVDDLPDIATLCDQPLNVGAVGTLGVGFLRPWDILVRNQRTIVVGEASGEIQLATLSGPGKADFGFGSALFVSAISNAGLPASWTITIQGAEGPGESPSAKLFPTTAGNMDFGIGFQGFPGKSIVFEGPSGKSEYEFLSKWNYVFNAVSDAGTWLSRITYSADEPILFSVATGATGAFGLGILNGTGLRKNESESDVLDEPASPNVTFLAKYVEHDASNLGDSEWHATVPAIQGASVAPDDNGRVLLLGLATAAMTIPDASGSTVIEASTDARIFQLGARATLIRSYVVLHDAADLFGFVGYRLRIFPLVVERAGGGAYVAFRIRDGLRVGSGATEARLEGPRTGLGLAAFDGAGTLAWLRRVDWLNGDIEPFNDSVSRMDPLIRSRGEAGIVIGGHVTGTISVENPDGAPIEITNPGGDGDGFLVGYTWDGKLEFAFNAVQGAGRGGVKAIAVTEDAIVVGGDFEGPTTFGPGGKAGAINDISGYGGYLMRLEAKALQCGEGFDSNPGP